MFHTCRANCYCAVGETTRGSRPPGGAKSLRSCCIWLMPLCSCAARTLTSGVHLNTQHSGVASLPVVTHFVQLRSRGPSFQAFVKRCRGAVTIKDKPPRRGEKAPGGPVGARFWHHPTALFPSNTRATGEGILNGVAGIKAAVLYCCGKEARFTPEVADNSCTGAAGLKGVEQGARINWLSD